jgi:hypothetical protein
MMARHEIPQRPPPYLSRTYRDYSRNIHEEHSLEHLTKKGKTMFRTSSLG